MSPGTPPPLTPAEERAALKRGFDKMESVRKASEEPSQKLLNALSVTPRKPKKRELDDVFEERRRKADWGF